MPEPKDMTDAELLLAYQRTPEVPGDPIYDGLVAEIEWRSRSKSGRTRHSPAVRPPSSWTGADDHTAGETLAHSPTAW